MITDRRNRFLILARGLCRRGYEAARLVGHYRLAAEALNTLGGLELTTGSLAAARRAFLRALECCGGSREVRARVEQNLGILANVQGDLKEALSHYRRSLEAYDAARDAHGCAIAYHNLGMVSADREEYSKADRYFRESRRIAEDLGDLHLQALSLVGGAEVAVARQQYETARQDAEEALPSTPGLG
jgi:tetratricopeptide (TPR) repeat protein